MHCLNGRAAPRVALLVLAPAFLVISSLFAVLLPAPLPAPLVPKLAHAAELADACAALEARAEQFPGRVGLVVVDLEGRDRCEIGATEVFVTASLYKVVLLAEAYAQAEAGTYSFDEPLELLLRHAEDDSPERRARLPETVTGEQAARLMIVISDNASAVALRERLGLDALHRRAGALGMNDTILLEDAFSTTAADVATLFTRLARGQVVSPEASTAMLELLLDQQVNDRLPVGLPANTPIAHKTGNLESSVHDAGIVFAPGGRYVIVVLTEVDGASVEPAYEVIPALSALAYEAFAEPRPPVVATMPAEPPQLQVASELLTAPLPAVESEGAGDPAAPGAATTTAGGEPAAVAPAASEASRPAEAPAGAATGEPGPAPAANAEREAGGGTSLLGRIEGGWSDASDSVWEGLLGAAGGSEPLRAQLLGVAGALSLLPVFVLALRWRRGGPDAPGIELDPSPYPPAGYASLPGQFAPPLSSPSAEPASSAGARSMRFGSRTKAADEAATPVDGPDEEPVEEFKAFRPPEPSGEMHMDSEPAAASERLRRIATYFSTNNALLSEMSTQIESETAPLAELLGHQATTMQLILTNLEERLRPLNEYADHEEANLRALEERIDSDGMEFIQRSFSEYVDGSRRRIDETRRQIDEQRDPFLDFRDDQRESVEIALSRFDSEFDALEKNLAEQRRVLMRILDAMRSDSFTAVLDFLAARQETLLESAEAGITDPNRIATSLSEMQSKLTVEPGHEYLRPLLSAAEESDARLMSAAAAAAGPRPLPGLSDPPALAPASGDPAPSEVEAPEAVERVREPAQRTSA